MSADELRDRIAAVLTKDAFGLTTLTTVRRQAEAIIAELGLTQETSYGTTYPKVPVIDREYHRWVTDWRAADE